MKERNEIMRFFGLHPQNDVRRKFGATHVENSNNKRRFAFTLAEVLITLGIIGVVAALTIPTLVANYQTKSFETAKTVFENRLNETLKTMNTQGALGKYGKYKTTEGFVEELQKHMKLTNVCDKDHLMQCFPDKITMNDEEVDLSQMKYARDIGQPTWGTNLVGVQVANGVTALLAYNPDCKSDPYDNTNNGGGCYAIVYDTSGFANPNEYNKDVNKNAQAKKLGGNSCAYKLKGSACFDVVSAADLEPMSKADCEKKKGTLGISYCNVDNDYWAAAVEYCGGKNKMIDALGLTYVAEEIYGQYLNLNNNTVSNLTMNTDKVSQAGLPTTGFMVYYNLEVERNDNPVGVRAFYPNYAYDYTGAGRNTNYNIYVMCKTN